MIFLKLETLDQVNYLTNVCETYKDKMDVDISHGRYIVDGRSVLGVTSMLGNIIKIIPRTEDELLINYFYKDLEEIGVYKINKEERN